MKTITTRLLIVLVSLVLTSCGAEVEDTASPTDTTDGVEVAASAEPACDLVGSWEMVSMQEITPDSVVEYDESQRPTLKILNDTHWMFIRQSAAEFIFAQGGRYTLEGDQYTEIVDYSAEPANIGARFEFTCRVEGDTWYHMGGGGDTRWDEVWRRVE